MIRITVVGTGYVGLVTGACLADFGNRVTCVDVDRAKIDRLQAGEIPFYEPGLKDLVERNRDDGRLAFGHDVAAAVRAAQVVFCAVGTPPLPDGSADLSAVFEVGRIVAGSLGGGYKVVVQKSTAPVGTARRLWDALGRRARGGQVDVASNPEFLREGSAIETFMRPDRVVIGAETARSERLLREIYRPLYLIETPMVVTNLETAELVKYASNAFLATKISFINEMANLCEAVGADVQVVAKAMGLDGRIGAKFLHAGPGYGGSCFPKDTQAMVRFARQHGERVRLVESTIAVNRAQHERMVEKIARALGGLRGRRVAVLGLSFKPETDDLRASPALAIIQGLLRRGARVTAHDPVAMDGVRATPLGRRIALAADAYEAARGADAVALVTEWNPYRRLDLAALAAVLRRPVLFDLRNVYEPEAAAAAGLEYHGVGRGTARGAGSARPRRAAGRRPRRQSAVPRRRQMR